MRAAFCRKVVRRSIVPRPLCDAFALSPIGQWHRGPTAQQERGDRARRARVGGLLCQGRPERSRAVLDARAAFGHAGLVRVENATLFETRVLAILLQAKS